MRSFLVTKRYASRNYDIAFRYYKIVFRNYEIASRNYEIVKTYFYFVAHTGLVSGTPSALQLPDIIESDIPVSQV